MVELAYTADSKSAAEKLASSSLAIATIFVFQQGRDTKVALLWGRWSHTRQDAAFAEKPVRLRPVPPLFAGLVQ